MELHHFHVLLISLLLCHCIAPLMLRDKLCNELLLSHKWHPLHGLLQMHLLLVGHPLCYLVELLLQLLRVLESLCHDFLLGLLIILLLLFSSHALDDGLHLRLYLLQSFVCLSEFSRLKTLSDLIGLQIPQRILNRHHFLLFLREQVATC